MARRYNTGQEIEEEIKHYVDSFTKLPRMTNVENLYDQSSAEGLIRADNLKLYLQYMAQLSPKTILIGEAPGYQGTSRTGVPFTSEFILNGGMPDVTFFDARRGFKRTSSDSVISKEPTSTIMWRTIAKCETLPLLWAAFPHHPYNAGNFQSNRPPTKQEIIQNINLLKGLMDIFRIKQIIAVGNVAKHTLDTIGIGAIKIRHPSRGGALIFAEQLYLLLPLKS